MYLNYIKVNGQILGAAEFDNTFGWDNKHAGARILVSKVSILHCTANKTINIMFSNLQFLFSWFKGYSPSMTTRAMRTISFVP